MPQFGDEFSLVKTEKEARQATVANRIEREREAAETNVTGADILKMMSQKHEAADFNVIIKADVQGSLTSVNRQPTPDRYPRCRQLAHRRLGRR